MDCWAFSPLKKCQVQRLAKFRIADLHAALATNTSLFDGMSGEIPIAYTLQIGNFMGNMMIIPWPILDTLRKKNSWLVVSR